MLSLIGQILFGLVVGVIAKLLMPGRDPGGVVVTAIIGAVAPDWVLIVFSIVAMVGGLAYVLRSPFLLALGTTVLTVATGYLAGTSSAAVNRLFATLAGAAVGLLATGLIPVPKPQEQTEANAPPDPDPA